MNNNLFIFNFNMATFIKKIALFILFFLIIFVVLSCILLKNNTHIYAQLYNYQIDKLESENSYVNLFIGDSSLGNSIDSELFSELSSQKTINCALSGIFGYAGSYNMLKKAHKKNPTLKNVILMQAINMQRRKLAMDGYVRSASFIDFIEEEKKVSFIKNYYEYIRSIPLDIWNKKDSLIINDYMRQSKSYSHANLPVSYSRDSINFDKTKYLLKIKNYCQKNDINLIYVHGPLYENIVYSSNDYITEVNQILISKEIKLIETIIPIKKKQLGDTENHVHPDFKETFTRIYYNILKNELY